MSEDGIVIQEPGAPNQGQDLKPEQNTDLNAKEPLEQPLEQEQAQESAQDNLEESPDSGNEDKQDSQSDIENEEPASFKKRINKAHAEKIAAQQYALQLEQELIRARGGQQTPQVAQQFIDPYAPREPDENDPKYASNNKAYLRDYVDYQKRMIGYESQRNQRAIYKANVVASYSQEVEQARAKYEDFDEALNELRQLPIANTPGAEEIVDSILEAGNGAEIAYYYAKKNRDDFIKLFNMPTRKAVLEVGKLSARLSAVPAPPPKPPPPPKNFKGTGVLHQKKSIDDMSIDDLSKVFRSYR